MQAVGTPDNLLVKNIHFEAPRRPDGYFADFTTDLAVYRNGQEVARKIIRVNDPLQVRRLRLPPEHVRTGRGPRDPRPTGALVWDGPILLDGERSGSRRRVSSRSPARTRSAAGPRHDRQGIPLLAVTGLGPTSTPGREQHRLSERRWAWATRARRIPPPATPSRGSRAAPYTGMVIKRDPGQGLIWSLVSA